MSEAEIAHDVEVATLTDMSDMDIDNVYTLMDVQLRERPGPMELYRRWERQNWEAFAIDFTEDAVHWENLPDLLKREILFGLYAFFLGEAAVTDTLSPIVHAAPTDEDRHFLTTQLVDEARHTIFFDRFFREVLKVDGLAGARKVPEIATMLDPAEPGYGKLFYTDLVNLTDRIRQDPGDYGLWVEGIVLYHMLIEGMLALYGQRQLLRAARLFGVLPGFRGGFTAVTRDESRHVNYGVYALRRATEAGLHDRIVDATMRYLDGACDLLTRPLQKIELPPEEIMAIIPEEIREDSFWEEWAFPTMQLRKRLRVAGVRPEAIDGMDRFWWQRIEANLDDYEQRFGEPHPAREEDPEIRDRVLQSSGG